MLSPGNLHFHRGSRGQMIYSSVFLLCTLERIFDQGAMDACQVKGRPMHTHNFEGQPPITWQILFEFLGMKYLLVVRCAEANKLALLCLPLHNLVPTSAYLAQQMGTDSPRHPPPLDTPPLPAITLLQEYKRRSRPEILHKPFRCNAYIPRAMGPIVLSIIISRRPLFTPTECLCARWKSLDSFAPHR